MAAQSRKAGATSIAALLEQSGGMGEYFAVNCRCPADNTGVFVQQLWDSSICELPHSSAMCWQHSLSSLLIAKPGKVHAANGADASATASSRCTALRNLGTTVVYGFCRVVQVMPVTVEGRGQKRLARR
jgi:hypothetical protein